MGDPAVSGATAATDTDYALEAMVQGFIAAEGTTRNRFVTLQGDAMGAISRQFTAMGELAGHWLSNVLEMMPGITTVAIQGLNASTADSILNFIATGERMASSNPPIPSNFGVIPQGNPASGGISGTLNGGGDNAKIAMFLQAIMDRITALEAKTSKL